MSDAVHSLPDLKDPYHIRDEQIRDYRECGHVLLRGILSRDEVEIYREVIKAAACAGFGRVPCMADRDEDDFSRIFLQAFNIRETDPGSARFILAPRFGKIVADLMGVAGVRIYYDKAMFKEPESRITPWHQDGPHWPLYGDNVLTFWIPLVDIEPDMGPLRFATGTHRRKRFGPRGIHKDAQCYYEAYIKENHLSVIEEPIKAGDATLHNHWVLHGAGRNTSRMIREVMGMTFYEDGMVVDDSACDEMARPIIDASLGNRRPGEQADSDRNQVVYSVSTRF
ncbi:uncharacterized protein METZ01_LOCUS240942 [marine metagenome]|uniref:Phytanoyl-CoA dioxygenase n=1 Tax=marine metagenome TaxID=408172 RepID=A0A382HLA9_9ZZZZ